MLLGHAVNKFSSSCCVEYRGISLLSLHCKVSNISGLFYCHVYTLLSVSFPSMFCAHPGVWWPLRELHFTLSAISYTLHCGCKQSAKVFVMKAKDLEQSSFYVPLYLSIRRLGHLHAHIYSIFLCYLGWYI